MAGGTILLFYYNCIILAKRISAIAFGIFFLGEIKGPSRSVSSVLVTLMMAMLYVPG